MAVAPLADEAVDPAPAQRLVQRLAVREAGMALLGQQQPARRAARVVIGQPGGEVGRAVEGKRVLGLHGGAVSPSGNHL
jgi:hypothetical protein